MARSTSRNDSAGSLPGNPREGGGAPLSGRVVLLPRLKERDRIASALERAGARVLRAAVTRTVHLIFSYIWYLNDSRKRIKPLI